MPFPRPLGRKPVSINYSERRWISIVGVAAGVALGGGLYYFIAEVNRVGVIAPNDPRRVILDSNAQDVQSRNRHIFSSGNIAFLRNSMEMEQRKQLSFSSKRFFSKQPNMDEMESGSRVGDVIITRTPPSK